MGIQASCSFDEKTLTAFNRCMMTRKGDPKKSLWSAAVIYGILIAVMLLEMWWFGAELSLQILLILLIVVLVCLFSLYFWMGKIQYRRLGSMQGLVNSYVFYQDAMEVTSDGTGYNADGRIQYHAIKKVKETRTHFFIFMNNRQAFMVDKSTITGGTADQIRGYLSVWVDEKCYTVCKY